MKKLTYFLFIAIGTMGCSVESLDSTENLLTADLKTLDIETTDPSTLTPIIEYIYNNGNKDQGKVEITNECDSVTITFTSYGEELDVEFGLFSDLPALNNGGNLANSVVTFEEEDLDENYSYTYSFSDIGISSHSEDVIVYAKAFGKDAGSGKHGKINFFVYDVEEVTCEPVCESGYMNGNKDFSEIGTSNNWGWAHQFNFVEAGFESREIYQKNSSLDGEVTILWDNGTIEVTSEIGVNITHIYVSDEEPTSTNAPGQFDKDQTYYDEDGTFWVIIKAEVCE